MYRLLSLSCCCFFLFACGDTSVTADGTTAAVTTSAPANHRSCLNDFTGDLCDLLQLEDVADLFPGTPERKAYKSTERKSTSSCGLSFESPTETRVMDLGTMKMTVPVDYSVAILSFKASKSDDPLARFRSTYKTLTPEEIAATRKKMEEGLKAKFDAGEIDQETYDAARKFDSVIGKATYENVPGIGTAAVWGGYPTKGTPAAGDLYVLDGDYTFSVNATMGENRADSKAAAIAVAKAVLARCE